MRALAVLVLAPAFALGAVAGAVGIVGKPLQQTQKPDSLVWAGRVFATEHSFDKWLRARGASYAAWAGRHPSTAAVFAMPGERRLAATSVARSTHRTKGHWLLAGVVAAAALVFLLAAAAGGTRRPARERSRVRSKDKPPVSARAAGRLHVLIKSAAGWPVLAAPATAVRHPPSLAATEHDLRVSPRVRRLLPTIVFHAASFVRPARGLGSRLRSKDKRALPARAPGRLQVLIKSAAGWPALAAPATAVRHPPSLAATVHDLRVSPRVRRVLPRVAFYSVSFVLAIVIGAAVAISIR